MISMQCVLPGVVQLLAGRTEPLVVTLGAPGRLDVVSCEPVSVAGRRYAARWASVAVAGMTDARAGGRRRAVLVVDGEEVTVGSDEDGPCVGGVRCSVALHETVDPEAPGHDTWTLELSVARRSEPVVSIDTSPKPVPELVPVE